MILGWNNPNMMHMMQLSNKKWCLLQGFFCLLNELVVCHDQFLAQFLCILPQTKTLSLADEFSPPNTQYMFSSLAAMGLNFKPLLDVCSKNIAGENDHDPLRRSQN